MSGTSGSSGTNPPSNPFTQDAAMPATKVAIEIDYQAGAEPYTGTQPLLGDPWDLFKVNATKLFEGTGKSFDVPTTIDKMEKLTDITGTMFDSAAILAIAAKHRSITTSGDTIGYYFLWLNGTYVENGTENKSVLGVSLGNTGVLAMFKPVIKGAGPSSGPLLGDNLDAAVEQTVLVHEFGHAVGLVNNGVALTSQHQDTAHGAHCSNQDCVMYWTVDGSQAAGDYVKRRVTGSSSILFADDCLADIRGAK